ncbi:hypothetical protein BBJ28_00018326 [Nothophytophthora sp. Chile5]|nr:hypothetical protein BBJ28_00018326 [Nothophytophthora sp. Chile5]
MRVLFRTVARRQQTMESLDANYALLSEVSARNHALQARLRSSLPLLWRGNALVLNSAATRRRWDSTATNRDRHLTVHQLKENEAGHVATAIEEIAQQPTDRRYRRRVEWEVARRIARVDRELQKYPPAQRFWHQKKRVYTKTSSVHRLARREVKEVEVKARDAGIDRMEKRVEVAGSRGAGGSREPTRHHVRATVRKQEAPRTGPSAAVQSNDEKRRTPARALAMRLHAEASLSDDKENDVPSPAAQLQPKIARTSSVNLKASAARNASDIELVEVPTVQESLVDCTPTPPELPRDFEANKSPSVSPPRAKPIHQRQGFILPVDEVSNDRDENGHTKQQGSAIDLDSTSEAYESPRRMGVTTEDRPSSSIGRQVLSEYRTMPSVASFGAQPTLSTGGPGRHRLNADVLRRLFSDLDADRDGHVNRIETCMALHRLQISIPAAKIVSFFRHIHSSPGNGQVRSRHAQHMPLKEVINYKEFVAFITAAYDQQQQRIERVRAPPRRKERQTLPSLSLPSTSLPIFTNSSPPRSKKNVKTVFALQNEHEIRRYEVEEDPNDSHATEVYEDKVLKTIPDLLVARILADAVSTPVRGEAKETASSIVRKSLESLVGRESVDGQTVAEIAQQLIREHLQRKSTHIDDGSEDITGLRRAAVYYEEQMARGPANSSCDGDSVPEDPNSWVDILTEEQVSGLVQQIWKDRQARVLDIPAEIAEVESIQESPEASTGEAVALTDEAVDTSELQIDCIAMVADKAVQAADNGESAPSATEVIQPIGDVQELQRLPTTHLGRALDVAFGDPERVAQSERLYNNSSAIQMLQQLRQQRRAAQSAMAVQSFRERASVPDLERSAFASEAAKDDNVRGVPTHLSEEEHCCSSGDESPSVSSPVHRDSEDNYPLLMPTKEPVALVEKVLDDSGSNQSSNEGPTSKRSFSMSSSDFGSISESHDYGIEREISRQQLHAGVFRRRRRRRQRRLRNATSGSGSSVRDSIGSAELSEGELTREELSDGELYGENKKNYLRHKNATVSTMRSETNVDDLASSVESGELLPIVRSIPALSS